MADSLGVLKKGTPVSINNTLLKGVISKVLVQDDDQIAYMVHYIGTDKELHHRTFTHDEVTAMPVEEKAEAVAAETVQGQGEQS